MLRWSNALMALYPNVKIEVKGEGSATAIPALVDGTAQFGPMSRPLSYDELQAFTEKYGYKENPVPCFTVHQVNLMFSLNSRGAFGLGISTWGEVGDWAKQPIVLYG